MPPIIVTFIVLMMRIHGGEALPVPNQEDLTEISYGVVSDVEVSQENTESPVNPHVISRESTMSPVPSIVDSYRQVTESPVQSVVARYRRVRNADLIGSSCVVLCRDDHTVAAPSVSENDPSDLDRLIRSSVEIDQENIPEPSQSTDDERQSWPVVSRIIDDYYDDASDSKKIINHVSARKTNTQDAALPGYMEYAAKLPSGQICRT